MENTTNNNLVTELNFVPCTEVFSGWMAFGDKSNDIMYCIETGDEFGGQYLDNTVRVVVNSGADASDLDLGFYRDFDEAKYVITALHRIYLYATPDCDN